jgi:mRNA-degrading endonuclease RelE of RelBE toxin-antitoxin system
MNHQIEFIPPALEQLRALPKDGRRLIGAKLDRAQPDLTGDLKKLKGFKNKYRLRAGNWVSLDTVLGGTGRAATSPPPSAAQGRRNHSRAQSCATRHVPAVAGRQSRGATLSTSRARALAVRLRTVSRRTPGNYRVLFELEGNCLVVYDVGDRKDIYE